MRKLLLFFAAGCLGALVNSLVVWFAGNAGFTRTLGVAIAPGLTAGWLYPRIVWGGLWGAVFFLPIANAKPIVKGTILSLFPTAIQLFVVFPYKAHKGLAGLELGLLTPVFVLAVNWVWGVVTALTIKYAR
jgi:hypothetical protein